MTLKEFLESVELPKYENSRTRGYYANGNYKGVSIQQKSDKSTASLTKIENISERILAMQVVKIEPRILSGSRWNVNIGLMITLE